MRGKCVSAAPGFVYTQWPSVFTSIPKVGDLVYKLPTITGALNTPVPPVVTESVTSMTISSVAHRMTVFQSGSVYVLEPYIEVALS